MNEPININDLDVIENPEPKGGHVYDVSLTAVKYHPKMNINALNLFDRIDYFSNNEFGYCWASNEILAHLSAQSVKAVEKNLKLLEEIGFIRRERKIRSKNDRVKANKNCFESKRKIFVTIDRNRFYDYVPKKEDYYQRDNTTDPISRGSLTLSPEGLKSNNIRGNTVFSKEKTSICTQPSGRAQNQDSNLPILRRAFKKKTPKKNTLVEFWNSYAPLIRPHKDPSKKVYQRSIELLTLLKKGTFTSKCPVNGSMQALLRRHKNLLSEKWTDEMIIKAIQNASKLYLENYWPNDKKNLPKDLPTLIYNPRTKYSYLISCYIKEPSPLGKEKVAPEGFVEWWNNQGVTPDSKRLNDMISEKLYDLNEYWDKLYTIPDSIQSKIDMMGGKGWWLAKLKNMNILQAYADYLSIERGDVEWTTGMIGVDKPHWKSGFMKYLSDVYISGEYDCSDLFVR